MDNPDCNGKCSVAGTAKSEYDCLNAADGEQCCEWDDNSPNNAQRQDTVGVCHYLEFEDGIKMDDPTCNGKCSVAGTAKTEYDCNHADGGVCCEWDDSTSLNKCTKDAVLSELYKAADVCCDETTEKCDEDGWPHTCNLGCAAIMVPLVNKCLSSFKTLGLAASATPLQTATNKCPCPTQIKACDSDTACEGALDVLPGLTIPEYKEYFTTDDGRANHFNAKSKASAVKTALYNCYVQQNYPTTDPLNPGSGN